MNEDFINILTSGAKHFGFDYSPSTLKSFSLYNNMLKSYGETTNLTAIKDTADVARLHFLDSLAVLNAVDLKNKKVLDIGSGAGFPGIPLKLAEPSLDLTIIEATGKKVAFLVDLCNNLSINVKIIHNRAEELAKTQDMRE
ncbi:MAG: 16S rRNA (guanine(527)-N(7))-methyltransferase RsmG, partial [Oscillospiraceae bacterium]|nr:16S rRNA (guanine(527)-N(7))-methyltransferase RsmG [Oscillospiraceae bacterium]